MKQFNITPAMGKRLIAKALVRHDDIKKAMERKILVIVAGSTNGYIAEEILKALGQDRSFSREGFRRGVTVAYGAKIKKSRFEGDVVIRDGIWQEGKTIFDVVDDLKAGDVILKGANALDPMGQVAVHIGHPKGGTIMAALAAVVGRRVKLMVPVGLEKRVMEDVHYIANLVNSRDSEGPCLLPFSGEVFTEIEAIKLLTGAEAVHIAGGGIYGAEGSVWLGIIGEPQQLAAAEKVLKSIQNEPPCEI